MQKTIGSTILHLRQQRSLTQQELARLMDVSDDTVRRWEADALAPEMTQIPRLALHLQTDQSVLTGCFSAPADSAVAPVTGSSLRFLIFPIAGLLAAVILNWLTLPIPGFITGTVFIAAGILISLRKSAPLWVLFSQVILFGALLPLILTLQTHSSLPALRWLCYGSAFAAVTAMACFAARFILLLDRNVYGEKVRICLRHGLILLVVLLAVGLLHFLIQYFLSGSQLLYPNPIQFDNWDDFRDYMQIPLSTDGKTTMTLLSVEESGNNLIYRFSDPANGVVEIEDAVQTIPDPAGGEDLCTYLHLNRFVYSLALSPQGNLPVRIITVTDHHQAQQVLRGINILFIILYLLASAILAYLVYRKLSKIHESKSAARN